ncbi:hypothetical protein KNB15_002575 [Listeria monocytogenes]|nr:hypothetical protein [Listeria monocytogenes]EHO9271361.1 hypothetical protein [Listeria monocytogenes]EHQ4556334.1 hypothetical protein [Listeria monocytogenes]EIB9701420.1 hypothetical protein [Listeria monocytogenes]EJO6566196.1 hypothetical protein [Listeria monocytogenes]
MDKVFLYPIFVQEQNDSWVYENPQFENVQGTAATLEKVYVESKEELEKIIYKQLINNINVKPEPWKWEERNALIVEIDVKKVLEKYGSTPIRKMVSLPTWLSYQAEKEGLSLSKVLQETLKERLNRNEG